MIKSIAAFLLLFGVSCTALAGTQQQCPSSTSLGAATLEGWDEMALIWCFATDGAQSEPPPQLVDAVETTPKLVKLSESLLESLDQFHESLPQSAELPRHTSSSLVTTAESWLPSVEFSKYILFSHEEVAVTWLPSVEFPERSVSFAAEKGTLWLASVELSERFLAPPVKDPERW